MIKIRYCVVWNYYPRAASLAENIKKELGTDVKLESGDRGEFSVWYKKQLVCQKTIDGYPPPEDVVVLLKEILEKY